MNPPQNVIPRRRPRGGRLARLGVVAAATAVTGLALLTVASSAQAASAPSGYTAITGWNAGATTTASLPSPYSGTASLTSGPDQTSLAYSGYANVVYPTTPAYHCLDGHVSIPSDDTNTCGTYTETLTFTEPVTNPVIKLGMGGGGWAVGGDTLTKCTGSWEDVTFSAVNGSAPTGLTPASPIDSPVTWDGATLALPSSAIPECDSPGWDSEYISVPGTVTSISFTYTLKAKTTRYNEGGSVSVAAVGGIATQVLLPPVKADLGVVKTVSKATVAPGDPITWTMTVTNHGPDPEPSWTLSDPLPAGVTDVSTSTSGCSIANSTLTCTGSNLAVGSSTTVVLTGKAPASAGTVVNTATVKGTAPDPEPGNNTSTTTTTVVPVVPVPAASAEVVGPLAGTALLIGGGVLLLRRRRSRSAA